MTIGFHTSFCIALKHLLMGDLTFFEVVFQKLGYVTELHEIEKDEERAAVFKSVGKMFKEII